MNGIIYCRVSSKEQMEGTSLDVQEVACRDYARSKNIKVLNVFVEQGESAKFADRTQLLALIDFCRANKGALQVLLVWKVDRFARNVADHYSVKATLAKYGVRVISVTEPIDANPEGRLMETILAGFAQFDNDIRAMRTVQGMRRKIHEGIFPWGPPLGYKSSVENGEKKTRPDLPDRPTFDFIQRAFREFATGAYTRAEIGRRMQSWGLASVKARSFSHQSLFQLFTNRYYAGVLVDPWSGEEFAGKHSPAVSSEDFARVQQVIARKNRSAAHQKERADFPLRGVVRCAACLRFMTGGVSQGRTKKYSYYVCHSGGCPKRSKSYRAEDIHQEFESLLDSVAPKQEHFDKIEAFITTVVKQRQHGHNEVRARLRERAERLDREHQELIRMRAQSLITDQEFSQQRRRILEQRTVWEAKGEGGSINVAEACDHLREIQSPLIHLRQTWKSLRPPFLRRFDRLVLPGGFVVGESRTAELGLLFSTLGESRECNSSGVPCASEPLNRIVEEIHGFRNVIGGIPEEEKLSRRRFRRSSHDRARMRPLNL